MNKNITKKEKTGITQKIVKELFEYKEEGYLIWKVDNIRIKIGDIAGAINKSKGYYRVGIDGKKYLLHRIIFLWHHGYLPKYLDHIDKNKTNNRIENLRETTSQNNNRNSSQRKSSSGIKGISWDRRRFKWCSQIEINKKPYNLGRFDSFDDAVFARYKKEQEVNWNKSEESPAYIYLKEKNLI